MRSPLASYLQPLQRYPQFRHSYCGGKSSGTGEHLSFAAAQTERQDGWPKHNAYSGTKAPRASPPLPPVVVHAEQTSGAFAETADHRSSPSIPAKFF